MENICVVQSVALNSMNLLVWNFDRILQDKILELVMCYIYYHDFRSCADSSDYTLYFFSPGDAGGI